MTPDPPEARRTQTDDTLPSLAESIEHVPELVQARSGGGPGWWNDGPLQRGVGGSHHQGRRHKMNVRQLKILGQQEKTLFLLRDTVVN